MIFLIRIICYYIRKAQKRLLWSLMTSKIFLEVAKGTKSISKLMKKNNYADINS